MKHVPKYLLPRIAPVPGADTDTSTAAVDAAATDSGGARVTGADTGFVPFNKPGARGRGRGRGRGGRGGRGGGVGGRGGKRKADPLKKFGR